MHEVGNKTWIGVPEESGEMSGNFKFPREWSLCIQMLCCTAALYIALAIAVTTTTVATALHPI